jgi:hypothetical protein
MTTKNAYFQGDADPDVFIRIVMLNDINSKRIEMVPENQSMKESILRLKLSQFVITLAL